MPIFNDATLQQHALPSGQYGFSATRLDDLGATEYTLVTIVCDASPSVSGFVKEMENCLVEIVKACKFSPRADNLMIRLVTFATGMTEAHGFKLLEQCNLSDYKKIIKTYGGTALYDAAENAISAVSTYGKQLTDGGFRHQRHRVRHHGWRRQRFQADRSQCARRPDRRGSNRSAGIARFPFSSASTCRTRTSARTCRTSRTRPVHAVRRTGQGRRESPRETRGLRFAQHLRAKQGAGQRRLLENPDVLTKRLNHGGHGEHGGRIGKRQTMMCSDIFLPFLLSRVPRVPRGLVVFGGVVMVHVDCAFRMGKTHLVCQDYAAVATGEFPCVVLADGCSGSPNTDIGARLLARSALAHIANSSQSEGATSTQNSPSPRLFWEKGPGVEGNLLYYHQQAICAARSYAASLQLSDTACDATLLTLIAGELQWLASVFGDGVVAAQNRAGEMEVTVVSYPGGYPFYPNYLADDARRQVLLQQAESTRQIETFCINSWGLVTAKHSEICAADDPCSFVTGSIADYWWVAILSDGVHSFYTTEPGAGRANTALPLETVLPELLNFKTSGGQFAQRRMQKFQQQCASRGWQHHDDVAMGVIMHGLRMKDEVNACSFLSLPR